MAELNNGATGMREDRAVVRAEPAQVDVVRCGAELVALSERFYGRVFAGAIVFCGMAAFAALALLPVRTTGPLDRLTPAVVVAVLVLAATPLALWRAGPLYRLLRRRPIVELILVLCAAALIVYPLKSELWWPSCALLMLLATLVPLRRALAYCLVVLTANFAAHLVADDLHETAPVAIIGLWIGYPFWCSAFALGTDRLAAHVLRLNTTSVPRRPPPRRIRAWTTVDSSGPQPPPKTRSAATTAAAEFSAADNDVSSTPPALQRLTARQLQVVALLLDGLHYREVAACLSISVRQVDRHVAHAIARLQLKNVYELIAVAVAEGMVPMPLEDIDDAITREHEDARRRPAHQRHPPSAC